MLLKFRLLRFPDIVLKTCLVKPKRGNLEVYIVYLHLPLTLVVEVSESRQFSSNYVRPALVVFYPLASLARLVSSTEFLQPFLLVTVRSESKILFDAEPVGFTRFSPLQLLRRRILARIFLAFLS